MSPPTTTLSAAIDSYIVLRAGTKKAGTVRGNRSHLSRFLAHVGNINMKHLDSPHIESWLLTPRSKTQPNAVGHVSDSSWNQALVALRGFITYADSREMLSRPSAKMCYGLALRNLDRPSRLRLSPEQLGEMIETADHARDRMFLAMAANTALRASEIVTIRWRDIEPDGHPGFIAVTIWKSSKKDFMPITTDLREELERWRRYVTAEQGVPQPDWWLIPSKNLYAWTHVRDLGERSYFGKPNPLTKMVRVHTSARLKPTFQLKEPERIVQRALTLMGLPTHQEGGHTIRRSVALIYFEMRKAEGYDGALRATSALLHHSNVVVTERYLGLERETENRNKSLRDQPFLSVLRKHATVTELRPTREG